MEDPVGAVLGALRALAVGKAKLAKWAEERRVETGGPSSTPVGLHPWDTPQQGLGRADIQGQESPYVLLCSDVDGDEVFVRRAAFQMCPRLTQYAESECGEILYMCFFLFKI